MEAVPDHVHPGRGFEDVDLADRSQLQEWHVTYRMGEVGEEIDDALAPFIPLSLSFSDREVPADMRTIKYGLDHDFWQSRGAASEVDRQRLFEAALRRLAPDIVRFESTDDDVRLRQFVMPGQA